MKAGLTKLKGRIQIGIKTAIVQRWIAEDLNVDSNGANHVDCSKPEHCELDITKNR